MNCVVGIFMIWKDVIFEVAQKILIDGIILYSSGSMCYDCRLCKMTVKEYINEKCL